MSAAIETGVGCMMISVEPAACTSGSRVEALAYRGSPGASRGQGSRAPSADRTVMAAAVTAVLRLQLWYLPASTKTSSHTLQLQTLTSATYDC